MKLGIWTFALKLLHIYYVHVMFGSKLGGFKMLFDFNSIFVFLFSFSPSPFSVCCSQPFQPVHPQGPNPAGQATQRVVRPSLSLSLGRACRRLVGVQSERETEASSIHFRPAAVPSRLVSTPHVFAEASQPVSPSCAPSPFLLGTRDNSM